MQIIYAIAPACVLFFQGMGFKTYAIKGGDRRLDEPTFNVFNFLLCFLIGLPFALINKSLDWTSVMYGAFHGVVFCFMILFYSKACSTGKIAFNNFIMALAMLFPVVFFAITGAETVTPLQYVGLAVIIVACFLVSFGQKTDSDKPVPRSAYVFVAIAVVMSGIVSIFAKQFVIFHPTMDMMQYADAAFLTAFVMVTVYVAATTHFAGLKTAFKSKWTYICLVVVALATAFGNILFINLANETDSAIFFPINNGLPMVLAVLASPLFKEKISKMSLLGMAIGIVSVVLLNL
jgi:drug/metabolite transporter (DMT)-like permease